MTKDKLIYLAHPYDQGKSGLSTYIDETLAELEKYYEIVVFTSRSDEKFLTTSSTVKTFGVSSSTLVGTVINLFYCWFVLPIILILFYSNYKMFIPVANRRLMLFFPLKTVLTVHDFSQLHVKEKYSFLRMFYVLKILPFFISRAGKIMAISRSTQRDLENEMKIPPEKITLNYNGIRNKNLSFKVKTATTISAINSAPPIPFFII